MDGSTWLGFTILLFVLLLLRYVKKASPGNRSKPDVGAKKIKAIIQGVKPKQTSR